MKRAKFIKEYKGYSLYQYPREIQCFGPGDTKVYHPWHDGAPILGFDKGYEELTVSDWERLIDFKVKKEEDKLSRRDYLKSVAPSLKLLNEEKEQLRKKVQEIQKKINDLVNKQKAVYPINSTKLISEPFDSTRQESTLSHRVTSNRCADCGQEAGEVLNQYAKCSRCYRSLWYLSPKREMR